MIDKDENDSSEEIRFSKAIVSHADTQWLWARPADPKEPVTVERVKLRSGMQPDVKDEMAYREPTDSETAYLNKLTGGGFKRGEMVIMGAGVNKGHSLVAKLLKEREDPDPNSFTLRVDLERAVIFEDMDYRPGSAKQQLGRVQHRRIANALMTRTGKSRNEREGCYTFKKPYKKGKRHTRSGPNAPKIVQLQIGKEFDLALIRAQQMKEQANAQSS